MHYFSTNKKATAATFREAVLNGQPDDKGLYFPEHIPSLSRGLLDELTAKSNVDIGFEVMLPFLGESLSEAELFRICEETLTFDFPLVKISEGIFALELFHGPTLAFKDVGARFMSRCLRSFSERSGQKTVVIVATSGDTGGAVAAGFHNVENVEVVILYPKGKVSRVQELQLTTPGGNITAVTVRGNFDDCQALAKEALADQSLKTNAHLTSANSINVARWLPQQIYYFAALKQWDGVPPVVSVPSGNFGNICAGMLAQASGLPVRHFIAACNANDTIPRFLTTGEMSPGKSIATLSNAMDVALPSNFVRIMEIFAGDLAKLHETVTAVSVSDSETERAMREVWDDKKYVLDPHGAVGYRALRDYLENDSGGRGIFLETAHPVKFDSVGRIVGTFGEIPTAVDEMRDLPEHSIEIEPIYEQVSEIIRSKADK
jgi:threonine synthase